MVTGEAETTSGGENWRRKRWELDKEALGRRKRLLGREKVFSRWIVARHAKM
jgi:hypothetical protein